MTSETNIGENPVVRSRPNYVNGLDLSDLAEKKIINSVGDLPEADDNGEIHLTDDRAYAFHDFIMSSDTLVLGDRTPILGTHGSMAGFIHTDGGTAIKATDDPVFLRNLYIHALGGTAFDFSADDTTEILVESVSLSDAAALGNMSDIGTVDGYRVPSFKGCNFEDFDSGFTFTGTSKKIFFSECPFRGVTADSVTVLEFDADCDTDIVDITDCYMKGLQSDTKVVDVAGTINEIFQYRGTTHNSGVTKDNILNGSVGTEAVGTRVSDCFPLGDSDVSGSVSLDSSTTVTDSGSSATEIGGTTTLRNAERTDSPNAGELRYIGKDDRTADVTAVVSVSGSNTEFQIAIALNGTVQSRTTAKGFLPNNSNAVTVTTGGNFDLTENDVLTATVENTGGNTDLTAEELNLYI
jgi:hypothetical protein